MEITVRVPDTPNHELAERLPEIVKHVLHNVSNGQTDGISHTSRYHTTYTLDYHTYEHCPAFDEWSLLITLEPVGEVATA